MVSAQVSLLSGYHSATRAYCMQGGSTACHAQSEKELRTLNTTMDKLRWTWDKCVDADG